MGDARPVGCFLCHGPVGLKGMSPAVQLFVQFKRTSPMGLLVHRNCAAMLQRRANSAGLAQANEPLPWRKPKRAVGTGRV